MDWYGMGMGVGGWVLGGLFWLVLVGLLIWLVVQVTSSQSRRLPPPRGPVGEDPLEILDRRLARGEIDLDTYRAHRAALLEARGGQQ